MLFRNRVFPGKNDTEVAISLTPWILKNEKKLADRDNQEKQRSSGPIRRQSNFPAGLTGEMKSYVNSLQSQIAHSINYPAEAEDYGWEGTVKLGLLILNDGTLAMAMIKETSGYDLLDELALSTAKRMAPFDRFPPETDLQELNVTVPIVYSFSGK